MPQLAHLLTPLIAAKAKEIEDAVNPQPPMGMQRAGSSYLMQNPGAMSEGGMYAGGDLDRDVQRVILAGKENAAAARHEASGDQGFQSGRDPFQRRANADRLARKEDALTAQDVEGMSKGDLNAVRNLRAMNAEMDKEFAKYPKGTVIDPRALPGGYLKRKGADGEERTMRFTPHLDTGAALGDPESTGVASGQGSLRYRGPVNPTIDPYPSKPLAERLQNRSADEAAKIVADDIEKKRMGYLGYGPGTI